MVRSGPAREFQAGPGPPTPRAAEDRREGDEQLGVLAGGEQLVCLAVIVEDDKTSRGKLILFSEAEAICETGLAATTYADRDAWKDVEARLVRPPGRINAAVRRPPAAPYNARPPHCSRFVKD